jgi:CheY-like chemotaxis protein
MTLKKKTILLVDDDEEDRLLLKDAFEELGYGAILHFEKNGQGAINYLQTQVSAGDVLPCLVILDLNMPRLNGRQTLQAIKKDSPLRDVEVIIYSTSLNPTEREECLALGAHSYVVKPITYRESLAIAEGFYQLCTALAEKTAS